jgi:hypothetical protein
VRQVTENLYPFSHTARCPMRASQPETHRCVVGMETRGGTTLAAGAPLGSDNGVSVPHGVNAGARECHCAPMLRQAAAGVHCARLVHGTRVS